MNPLIKSFFLCLLSSETIFNETQDKFQNIECELLSWAHWINKIFNGGGLLIKHFSKTCFYKETHENVSTKMIFCENKINIYLGSFI